MARSSNALVQRVTAIWAPQALRLQVQEIVRQCGGRRVIAFRDDADIAVLVAQMGVDLLLVDENAVDPDPWSLASDLGGLLPAEQLPRIVLMTGEPTRRKLEESLAAGIGSVIAKPFSAQTLMCHVARVLPAGQARSTELPDRVFLD
jgi:CheY-like chemotaxis protein